ncbi:MAG: hypothetical protein AAF497_25145, partial [Planctomycetota bacterium]
APHIQLLLARSRRDDSSDTIGDQLPAALRPVLLVVLLVATTLVSGSLLGQLRMISVRRDCYPVSAFQYMSDQQLRGNLVLRFSWAQYAIAAFGDEHDPHATRVAFDGRFRTCYPQQVVDMYFDFALGEFESDLRHRESGNTDSGRILDFRSPDLALIDRNQGNMVSQLTAREGEWCLLYRDELAELWGRSDKYDEPTSPDYLPPHRRSISDTPQVGFVAWPALPTKQSKSTTRDSLMPHATNLPREI